jgi:hypothetical protein
MEQQGGHRPYRNFQVIIGLIQQHMLWSLPLAAR